MKEGFTQAKEAQKKENPKKDDPAQKSEQSKVMIQRNWKIRSWQQKKQQLSQATSKIRTTVSAARQLLISLWQN